MPIYEFQCAVCKRKIEKLFGSYEKMVEWLNSPADSNCDSVPKEFTTVIGTNLEGYCMAGKFEKVMSVTGKPIVKRGINE